MRSTSELPAWEILPAPDGHFRWTAVAAVGDPGHQPGRPPLSSEDLVLHEERSPPGSRLPSMMDVLIQARPMLLEDRGDGDDASVPMFRTGLGKSVSVSERSIRKARTVLGGGDDVIGGKSVNEEASSIRKGEAVVRRDDEIGYETSLECTGKGQSFPALYTGPGKLATTNESSIMKAATILETEDSCTDSEANLLQRNKVDVIPTFHTGLGRKITIKESSIRKAVAALEGENKGFETGSENRGEVQSFSMFNTGSGKSVSLNESSIRKAEAVLVGEESIITGFEMGSENRGKAQSFSMFSTGSGKSVTLNISSIRKAATVLEGEQCINKGFEMGSENRGKVQSFSMFNTGSGKSVTLNESSIRKAAAVLEGEEMINSGFEMGPENRVKAQSFSMFNTGSGKLVPLNESSIRKATAVLEGQESIKADQQQKYTPEGKCNFSNSLFQTASGRNVNLSSSDLLKATKLLGLDGQENLSNIQDINNTTNRSNMLLSSCHNLYENFSSNINRKTAMARSIDVTEVQLKNDFYSKDLCSNGDYFDNGSSEIALKSKIDSPNHLSYPTIKYHTASGRSVSVSNDALQRARDLLGDSKIGLPENIKNKRKTRYMPETLPNPSKSSFSYSLQCNDTINFKPDQERLHSHLTEKTHNFGNRMPHMQQALRNDLFSSCGTTTRLSTTVKCTTFGGPLDDISNVSLDSRHMNQLSTDNRRVVKKSSISPFKKPRSSMFTTPLRSSITCLSSGTLEQSAKERWRTRISMHYPFRLKKLKIHEFFRSPPIQQNMVADLADEVWRMNSDRASTYKFCSTSGLNEIEVDNFWNMLLQIGASAKHATKEWVTNHYKWIVWKLASLERSYPTQAKSKYLTVSNVLEELKYRYEREVNYGHRSAIKKILDGDASPASMMILCISAIHSKSKPKLVHMDIPDCSNEDINKFRHSLSESHHISKIELTDGWYSLDAFLDVKLSKYLAAGKLYVGQKLRVWGASLSGWVGSVSPLEASETVAFQIHVNGTYRAHWADTLGFCKSCGPPLAFRCIKSGGGMVPRTLVGITRLYPILYRERLPDGGSIVRTEVMEKKALHLYHQRQSDVVEGLIYEQQDLVSDVNDSDEGAKIYKILETSAEPEVLMADMSSEQLVSLSNYRAKQNEIKQSVMQKKIDQALKDAGLASRDVTAFMKVRVAGIASKALNRRDFHKEGLITIWNPTENQKVDLVEGNIYIVTGLTPLNSYTDILYLHGRGSSTTWKVMHPMHTQKFETFFCPRRSVILSKLGEVALASEFDIAAVVLHVGDIYISGCQKKQWVFVTDGYGCSSMLHDSILAIVFSLPIFDNDSTTIFSRHYHGNTVGFCNLIKRARDQANHLWVAEATECSTYTISYNISNDSHLKVAAAIAQKWANESYQIIQKLRERVLSILDGHVGVKPLEKS